MSKLIKHLSKNDLIFILADYFGVSQEKVNLIPFISTEGYGMVEYNVLNIRAEIDITKCEK